MTLQDTAANPPTDTAEDSPFTEEYLRRAARTLLERFSGTGLADIEAVKAYYDGLDDLDIPWFSAPMAALYKEGLIQHFYRQRLQSEYDEKYATSDQEGEDTVLKPTFEGYLNERAISTAKADLAVRLRILNYQEGLENSEPIQTQYLVELEYIPPHDLFSSIFSSNNRNGLLGGESIYSIFGSGNFLKPDPEGTTWSVPEGVNAGLPIEVLRANMRDEPTDFVEVKDSAAWELLAAVQVTLLNIISKKLEDHRQLLESRGELPIIDTPSFNYDPQEGESIFEYLEKWNPDEP